MRYSAQAGFGFPTHLATSMLREGEIVVDQFAGGGGASEGLEQALGCPVEIAINHSELALGMHAVNHPFTKHFPEDVYAVDPLIVVAHRRVGWMHASPDCTHHSQARGGQPRDRATRALSWVVKKWVGVLRKRSRGGAPRIVSLENVEQVMKWGPLIAKRDKATGRVLTLDLVPDPKTGRMVNRVADKGERIPLQRQFLIPDPRRQGQTWKAFVRSLEAMGGIVEARKLTASDFGAGTSRTRLFMLARFDGERPRWPAPSHGKGPGLLPVVTAADCIDFTIPCPSIFTRKKPLAEATHRRVAKGIKRFVLDAAEPFIVRIGQTGSDAGKIHSVQSELSTIVGKAEHCLVAPTLVQAGYGERDGQAPRALDLGKPLGVVVAGGVKHALAAAHLVKFRGQSPGTDAGEPMPTITSGGGAKRPAGAAHALGVVEATLAAYLDQANTDAPSHDARDPVSTIVGKGCTQRLVTAHLMHASTSNTNGGRGKVDLPLRTVMAGGQHHAVVECTLSQEQEEGALRVAAFLMRYYGEGGQHGHLDRPMATITTKDRLALVTVVIKGHPYVIVDIGLRMLRPRELFNAQGFPRSYIIDRTADGRILSQSASVKLVGNSVSPHPMRAVAEANLDRLPEAEAIAA